MKMDAPTGLRKLADWFDVTTSDNPNTEVQQDLRRWADEWEKREARVKELEEQVKQSDATMMGALTSAGNMADEVELLKIKLDKIKEAWENTSACARDELGVLFIGFAVSLNQAENMEDALK